MVWSRNALSHSSGGQTSEIKVLARPYLPSEDLKEESVPGFLLDSGSPLAYGNIPLIFTWHSFYKHTSHVGLGAHPTAE